MRPSKAMERARTKAQEAEEKAGEEICKGLKECWGKAKGLRKNLKKQLPHVKRRTEKTKMPKKRRTRKGDTK